MAVMSSIGKSYQDEIKGASNRAASDTTSCGRKPPPESNQQLLEEERHDLYKSTNERFSRLLNNERADVTSLRNMVHDIHKYMDKHCDIVNEKEGKSVGGDGEIMELGHTSGETKERKHYHGAMC